MSENDAEKDIAAEAKIAKKAEKAKLKAAEKAKKAAKKLEKQRRKEALAKTPSEATETGAKTKKSKTKKPKNQSFAGTSLSSKVQAVARLMRASLASQLLEHGLYAGQEQVLFLLDDHGPLALTELAEKLDVRAPTITKTVARMEGQNFLSRAVSKEDARSIIIALAPEGRRVLKMCRQIALDVEEREFLQLSKSDCATLNELLDLLLMQVKSIK